jgi:hypothetical protein
MGFPAGVQLNFTPNENGIAWILTGVAGAAVIPIAEGSTPFCVDDPELPPEADVIELPPEELPPPDEARFMTTV